MMTDQQTFYGHVVTESAILYHHRIQVCDGVIVAIEADETKTGKDYILPGFRDQHIHDLIGQQMAVSSSQEELCQRFEMVLAALGRCGVTGVYLATFGDTVENLERYCRAARAWMDCADNGRQGAKLLGIHIEGSFLNVDCRGAQPAEHILLPSQHDCTAILHRLYDTGAVGVVNIVPDYGDASLQLIRQARELGLRVGSGHTKASADQLKCAYEKYGLQFMVHFTNGPTGQSFKPFHGGGAFEGAMNLPIHKELILDLCHIDPRYVLDILLRTEQRWGLDKIIGVTDALSPVPSDFGEEEIKIGSTIGKADKDYHCLFAIAYEKEDGTRTPAPPFTLCSSIISLNTAFQHLVHLLTTDIEGHWYHHTALLLDEAIVVSAKLCSTHQAGLEKSLTGSIRLGYQADLIQVSCTKEMGDYSFHLQKVWISGKPVI